MVLSKLVCAHFSTERKHSKPDQTLQTLPRSLKCSIYIGVEHVCELFDVVPNTINRPTNHPNAVKSSERIETQSKSRSPNAHDMSTPSNPSESLFNRFKTDVNSDQTQTKPSNPHNLNASNSEETYETNRETCCDAVAPFQTCVNISKRRQTLLPGCKRF